MPIAQSLLKELAASTLAALERTREFHSELYAAGRLTLPLPFALADAYARAGISADCAQAFLRSLASRQEASCQLASDAPAQLVELRAGLEALAPWVAQHCGPGMMWPRLCLQTMASLSIVSNGLPAPNHQPASVRFTAPDVQTLRPDWDDATAQGWLARNAKTIEERMTETGWQVIEHLLDAEAASTPPTAVCTAG